MLGGGFNLFLMFTPIPAKMIQFDLRIFFKRVGEKHQLACVFATYRHSRRVNSLMMCPTDMEARKMSQHVTRCLEDVESFFQNKTPFKNMFFLGVLLT